MDQIAPRRDEPGDEDRPEDEHDILTIADEREGDGRDAASKPRLPSRWIFVGVMLVLGLALAWGVYKHLETSAAATAAQERQADFVPNLRVVDATVADGPVELTLPGETQPFTTAALYARATGYVDQRWVDIGSRVHKGELLIHISAPDLDQQLEQAIATLGQVNAALLQAQANVTQSEANLNLAKVNLQRAQALVGQGFETLQNRDQLQANQIAQAANLESAKAGVKVAEANVKAQQADIDRLRALTAFEDVRAPFDGVVTARNVDVGTLINADSSSGTPAFTLDEDDILRVYVQVPENSALGVRDGLEARIAVPQFPGRIFVGTVSRSSSVLQTSARTLTVEVDIPNQAGTLRSGLFADITLDIPRIQSDVVVPAETLIFNQDGTHVAVVGTDDRVKMVPIVIRRDFGTSLDLAVGPKGGDKVVLDPPATLKGGDKVRIVGEEKGVHPPKPGDAPEMPASPPQPVPGGEGAGAVGPATGQAAE